MLLLVTSAHPSLQEHRHEGELHPNLGRLIQPRHTSSIEKTSEAGIPWAADNDCFQGLTEAAYRKMLDRIAGLDGCLFVTVPDVVGDAEQTLALFEAWIDELDRRGLPAALVAQDGLEDRLDRIPWDRIVALFIGGSTEWKEGPAAAELAREARRRGLWVHWGRVNTRRRFDLIVGTGAADSFDGSKWARFRKTYLDGGLAWCLEVTPTEEASTMSDSEIHVGTGIIDVALNGAEPVDQAVAYFEETIRRRIDAGVVKTDVYFAEMRRALSREGSELWERLQAGELTDDQHSEKSRRIFAKREVLDLIAAEQAAR